MTAVGVLDLVRRPRPVRKLPRRPGGALAPRGSRPPPPLLRALVSSPRRLIEVLVDFAIICISFLTSYLLFVDGKGTRHPAGGLPRDAAGAARRPLRLLRRLRDLSAGLALRLATRPARDRGSGGAVRSDHDRDRRRDCARSRDFPLEIFVVDALLCATLVAASRLALRLLPDLLGTVRGAQRARPRSSAPAARAARSPASWRETPDTRVVGFLDDNPSASPAAHPRRQGARRPSTKPNRCCGQLRLDEVLVTIPDVPRRSGSTPSSRPARLRGSPAASSSARSSPRRSLASGRVSPRRARAGALVARLARWLARRRLPRPRRALRLAGVAARDAVDLLATRSSSLRSRAGSPRPADAFAARRAEAASARSTHISSRRHGGSSDDPTAYAASEAASASLVMTAAIFPAYALARFVVSRPWAVFAAIGAAAAPALAYSPYLLEEPLAYPVSTLALLLIAPPRIAGRRAASVVLAVARAASCAVRPGQLAVLLPSSALVLLGRLWRTRARSRGGGRRGRVATGSAPRCSSSGRGRRFSAASATGPYTWYVATGFLKHRMLEYGLWAVGALRSGIAVLPADRRARRARPRAAGEPRDEPRDFVVARASRRSRLRALHGGQGAPTCRRPSRS